MFKEPFRGIALLGVLLVVVLFLESGSAVVSKGAITSASQGKAAVYTSQTLGYGLGAPIQPLPIQTPPPGHPTPPPGHHCRHGHHCPHKTPTPVPHGTSPR